jgi:RNA polymerase sigma factor (sigma-70 family)
MIDNELNHIIDGCRKQNQQSQYKLYASFYNYAMTIARRYVVSIEESEEVVNDTFMKVFNKIEMYGGEFQFKAWFRRILVNTAIDRLRAQQRLPKLQIIDEQLQVPYFDEDIILKLSKAQILQAVCRLPTAYRTVFNLYVVDEYSHEEISMALGISVGASKSNLSRARQHLKRILEHEEIIRNT